MFGELSGCREVKMLKGHGYCHGTKMLGEDGSCCRGAKMLVEHKGRGCQRENKCLESVEARRVGQLPVKKKNHRGMGATRE
ncbi:LOW QUALITY PROTEIN: hypothetical protein PHAVU_002G190800 [Phaseolus vulgaris]|uniref:Uncharacterized protein n=1 Tax=Phaseolus vulgaris TaxID=3885 RepID=V7CL77_PHAVU|nr:hypothetical protein PHAVU_002G190800g [Phaseolus vulgaris]ESW30889.1 hypothetical protein PHAVU_002G190800g [Phaseolus vulgaris]